MMIDGGKPDRAIPDLPTPALDLTEADRLADEGFAKEDEVAFPFDLAVGTDAADRDIAAVLGLAQPTIPAPRRAAIGGDRRPLAERLVRAVVVIAVPEGPEVPSGKWLEFGGGVISGLFNQPGPALVRRRRSRHDDG